MLFEQHADSATLASLGLIVGGAVLAARDDLAFSLEGYSWMLLNCFCTAGYVLVVRFQSRARGAAAPKVDDTTKALCNALVALPLFALLALGSGEVSSAMKSPLLNAKSVDVGTAVGMGSAIVPVPDFGFAGAVLLSGFLSFLLGISCFMCIQATSPTTMSIAVRFSQSSRVESSASTRI